MAFGIDDALMAAAASISLSDTVVQTVKRYRKAGNDIDIEQLIEEVRVTTLRRLDEADGALMQFERLLQERDIDTNLPLREVIAQTPFWKPFEQHRLKQLQKSFSHLWDSLYSAGDDIAALVRCRERTGEMGEAVVESAYAKHDLNEALLNAPSVKRSIEILRSKITDYKAELWA
jgi:hypothetical protein